MTTAEAEIKLPLKSQDIRVEISQIITVTAIYLCAGTTRENSGLQSGYPEGYYYRDDGEVCRRRPSPRTMLLLHWQEHLLSLTCSKRSDQGPAHRLQ